MTIGFVWGGVSINPADGGELVSSGQLSAGDYAVTFWLSSTATGGSLAAVSFRIGNTQLMRSFERGGGLSEFQFKISLAENDELRCQSESALNRRVAASVFWERLN